VRNVTGSRAIAQAAVSNGVLPIPQCRFSTPRAIVMPGLDPGIHLLQASWIAGSSNAKTRFALLPGNDDKR
jgi:hypothetical protein